MFNDRRIVLFERVALCDRRNQSSTFKTAQARALLVYLATHTGKSVTREQVATVIWPNDPSPTLPNRLSVALYQLRAAMDAVANGFSSCIVAEGGRLAISLEDVSCDLTDFKSAIRTARLTTDLEERRKLYQCARELFRGPLAPEVNDPWLVPMKVETEAMFEEAVVWLAQDLANREQEGQATALISSALEIVGTCENAAELLAGWYAASGHRSGVLACAKRLQTALADLKVPIGPRMREIVSTSIGQSPNLSAESRDAVFTVLVTKGVAQDQIREACAFYGGSAASLHDTMAFLNPLDAIVVGKELVQRDRRSVVIAHSQIMSRGEAVPNAAILSLSQARPGQVLCSEASAVLLRQAGQSLRRVRKTRLWRVF